MERIEVANDPSLNIVVADDDDLVRMMLRRALERAGYSVREAATCPTAISAANDPVDLIILDAHMPGGTLETTMAGVRTAAGPGIPILVLSGDHGLAAALSGPTVGFLAKPAQLDDLLSEIRRLLAVKVTR